MKWHAGIFFCGGMIIKVIDKLNESILKTTNRTVNNKFYKRAVYITSTFCKCFKN